MQPQVTAIIASKSASTGVSAMLREFIQSDEAQPDLFGPIGHLITDPKVHEALGNSVSSVEGDIWILNMTPSDRCNGFAQLRIAKNGTAHIRYVYAETDSVRASLVKAAVATARKGEAEIAFTNDRKDASWWKEAGFKAKPNARGGNFVRWELEDV